MDLIKKLTGKNPSEYEPIAKSLIDNSDVELFSKLVKQDDFLFDFIKENVAKRIQRACNKDNYRNLLSFLKYYSPSYDTVIAEVLHSFGGEDIYPVMRDLFFNGTDEEKAYAVKYLSFRGGCDELLAELRNYAQSEYEPLSINSIELLSVLKDDISKNEAIIKLNSKDEFEQYNAVKFLVAYGAKDALQNIIDVMKSSAFSESIAAEIPYLIGLEELYNNNKEQCILVICNIINAIPEIISPSAVLDFYLSEMFETIIHEPLTSSSALLLAMAKEKFNELMTNDEYLFDCDKNTKDAVNNLNELLKTLNIQKLKSYIYDELYEESDFVFYALDYADEVEELETLLDSKNQALVLKALTLLKDKGALKSSHKQTALEVVTSDDIKSIINAL